MSNRLVGGRFFRYCVKMPRTIESMKVERLGKVALCTEELLRLGHYRAVMVKKCLESGATWAEIGEAENMPAESARKHWGVQRRRFLEFGK